MAILRHLTDANLHQREGNIRNGIEIESKKSICLLFLMCLLPKLSVITLEILLKLIELVSAYVAFYTYYIDLIFKVALLNYKVNQMSFHSYIVPYDNRNLLKLIEVVFENSIGNIAPKFISHGTQSDNS